MIGKVQMSGINSHTYLTELSDTFSTASAINGIRVGDQLEDELSQ